MRNESLELAPSNAEVLIVGAGPTGLVLALVLARLGVAVRIIDQKESVAPYSRALGVHARTLEFYRQLGFADDVVNAGVIAKTANLWRQRRRVARIQFDDIGAGLTRYPFVLDFAQDAHERLLVSRLAAANVQVEWGTSFVRLDETGDGVRATLRRPGATPRRVRYAMSPDATAHTRAFAKASASISAVERTNASSTSRTSSLMVQQSTTA